MRGHLRAAAPGNAGFAEQQIERLDAVVDVGQALARDGAAQRAQRQFRVVRVVLDQQHFDVGFNRHMSVPA